MVTFSFIIVELYYLQDSREIMFIRNTMAISTKEKRKIIWICNEREDFSEMIILLFVLMALTSPLIMILSLCSS